MYNFQARVAALCVYSVVFFSMLAFVAVSDGAGSILITAANAPAVHSGVGIDMGPSVPSAATVFGSHVWSGAEDSPTF